MNKKVKVCFLSYFSVAPIFCFLLDLFMTCLEPAKFNKHDNSPDATQNIRYLVSFDNSYINQIIFFSIWTSLLLATWAICNLIHLKNNKMPRWITSKNLLTFINAYLLTVFFTYIATMIFMPNQIVGWDEWYNISKSVIEHFITPVLMIIFYLFIRDVEIHKTSTFAKKNAFKSLIFTSCYIAFITLRRVMLEVAITKNNKWNDYPIDTHALYPLFPYPLADPYNSVTLYFVGVLFLLATSYLGSVLFNFLSNVSAKSNISYKSLYVDETNKVEGKSKSKKINVETE